VAFEGTVPSPSKGKLTSACATGEGGAGGVLRGGKNKGGGAQYGAEGRATYTHGFSLGKRRKRGKGGLHQPDKRRGLIKEKENDFIGRSETPAWRLPVPLDDGASPLREEK